MEALGAYLKKNREQRGVSLEEMAASTKINISVLSFLEEDRFDKLPAPVFIKGFIKAYLGYLGLNPKEAVLFYELITGEAQKKQQILSPVTAEQQNNDRSDQKIYNIRLSQRGLIIIASVSVAMILTIMYFVIFPSSSNDDMSEYRKRMLLRMSKPTEAKVEKVPAIVETAPVTETTTTTTATATPAKKEEAKVVPAVVAAPKAPVVPDNPQKIVIKAQQDVWVKAQVDDGKPFDFLLRAGSVRKLDAKRELKILMGNTNSATVEYQGELIKDLGEKGRTRSIVFPGLERWKDAIVQ